MFPDATQSLEHAVDTIPQPVAGSWDTEATAVTALDYALNANRHGSSCPR